MLLFFSHALFLSYSFPLSFPTFVARLWFCLNDIQTCISFILKNEFMTFFFSSITLRILMYHNFDASQPFDHCLFLIYKKESLSLSSPSCHLLFFLFYSLIFLPSPHFSLHLFSLTFLNSLLNMWFLDQESITDSSSERYYTLILGRKL